MTLALGLRFFALAIIAGSALALPASGGLRLRLALGVSGGAALALLQAWLMRRHGAGGGLWFVPFHCAIWTYLAITTGEAGSPWVVGSMLEVPLSGALFGQRGALLAALVGAGLFLGGSLLSGPAAWGRVAFVIGFLAISAGLTSSVIRALRSQQRLILESRALLAARARGLMRELRVLGDCLEGALLRLDHLGRVTRINPSGASLLGVESEKTIGRPWQHVLSLDAPGTRAVCDALGEGTARHGITTTLERADGRRIAVQAEIWVTPSPAGRRTHVLLDPRLSSSSPEDPIRRLGEAAGCVAHQFKNSIHALEGLVAQVEHASREGTGVDTKRYAAALRSLGELADDVLGRAGARQPATDVNLKESIESALALGRWPDTQVRVEVPAGLEVRIPRARLVHALFNLIDNACRASAARGPVHVSATQREGHVQVEIADQGPGMRRSVPTADERDRPRGHGYGLLAVRRFLEESGGRLSISSRSPHGTLCRIVLPSPACPELVRARAGI